MQHPTARLMLLALRRFEQELDERIKTVGYTDVSIANMNLLRHLDADGMRMKDLAAHAGVTKQAVTQGVRALVDKGLVTLEPDPSDRRAKVVRYTPRGHGLIRDSIAQILEIEREMSERLGEVRYLELRAALEALS